MMGNLDKVVTLTINVKHEDCSTMIIRCGNGDLYINQTLLEELTNITQNQSWKTMSLKQKANIICPLEEGEDENGGGSIDYQLDELSSGYYYLLDWLLLALIEGLIVNDLVFMISEEECVVSMEDGRVFNLPGSGLEVMDWDWLSEVEDMVGSHFDKN